MGLFQWAADIYDYKIPYYRYYIARRILFSDNEERRYLPKESLFANKDYENFDLILKKSVKYSTVAGELFIFGISKSF